MQIAVLSPPGMIKPSIWMRSLGCLTNHELQAALLHEGRSTRVLSLLDRDF
jgi:hypothetical protein